MITLSAPHLNPVAEADLRAIATALVYLSTRLGHAIEQRVAERLIAEVAQCWPGEPATQWWKWLLEAGRSQGLSLRVADVDPKELTALVESGVAVITGPYREGSLVSIEKTGGRGQWRSLMNGQVAASLTAEQSRSQRVLLGDPDHGSDLGGHHEHPRPFTLLWKLLRPEFRDIATITILSGVAGLLMLSIPVTAQQLVRTVTFASLYQPIAVLSMMLLALLAVAATLQAMQFYIAEIIQRRLFVRLAATVAYKLPRATADIWQHGHPPELVNRFLDVVIVQKSVASLLVDGISIVLTTLIGMSVMAFYHPYLLGYDLALLLLLLTIVFGFGRSGVTTAMRESKVKYATTAWLEEVARCPSIFRTGGVDLLASQRTDALCADYLLAREGHFRVLLRQTVLILALQAIAITTLLGLGGILVLMEQLTPGQLIAAELIVAAIVASFAKLGKHLEGWYDLLAAVDKLSYLTDMSQESPQGMVGLPRSGAATLSLGHRTALHAAELNGSTHASAGQHGGGHHRTEHHAGGHHAGGHHGAPQFVTDIPAGSRVVLSGWDETEIEELGNILRGDHSSGTQVITIDGIDAADLRPDVLRTHAVVLREQEFLHATISENIHLHRPEVSEAVVSQLLDQLGLTERLRARGLGLNQELLPDGAPLTLSERRLVAIARALAARPRIVLLDQLLDPIPPDELAELVPKLSSISHDVTLLVATRQPAVAQCFPQHVSRIEGNHSHGH